MKKFIALILVLFLSLAIGIAKDKADDSRYEIEMAEIGEPGT